MKIVLSNDFKKRYKKLKSNEKRKLAERLVLFEEDPKNPILNNHQLRGPHKGYYSINITGDLRAIYELVKKDTALFIKVGTHSELYG